MFQYVFRPSGNCHFEWPWFFDPTSSPVYITCLSSNLRRKIEQTRIGFGRTEVSIPPLWSLRRDLENGHGFGHGFRALGLTGALKAGCSWFVVLVKNVEKMNMSHTWTLTLPKDAARLGEFNFFVFVWGGLDFLMFLLCLHVVGN